jgi:hypothetical protein
MSSLAPRSASRRSACCCWVATRAPAVGPLRALAAGPAGGAAVLAAGQANGRMATPKPMALVAAREEPG